MHRNHAVNLRRVATPRRRRPGSDWELKLEPPVNRVLPVARGKEQTLLAAFGSGIIGEGLELTSQEDIWRVVRPLRVARDYFRGLSSSSAVPGAVPGQVPAAPEL